MRKLLTTLLPYRNSLKQSDLYKNNLLPILLLLTTHLLPCSYKSFLFAHLINKASKMYNICL